MQKHDKVLANHRIEREEVRREVIKKDQDLKAAKQKIEQLSAENAKRSGNAAWHPSLLSTK